MKTILVRDLMVPLSEYATVRDDAALYEAVLALEKAQKEFAQQLCPHRALLVLDKNNKVVGRLSQWDVLRTLEPKYAKMGDPLTLSRAGFSPHFLRSMLEQYALWDKPLRDLCNKAVKGKVRKFMYTPQEGEYVDEKATLDEAIHQLVMGHHHSLLVTRGKEIVGILMLADVFKEVSEMIKTCEI